MTKEQLLDLLDTFVRSRPGFEPANYSNAPSYRADVRMATRQRNDALAMLSVVARRDGITAQDILNAAGNGRLSIRRETKPWVSVPMAADGTPMPELGESEAWAIDYCAGQYYCTEFRAGVCRVLASALWDYWRESAEGATTGDYIRAQARLALGRSIAKRWFN